MSTKFNPVRAGTAGKSAIAAHQRLVRSAPKYRSFLSRLDLAQACCGPTPIPMETTKKKKSIREGRKSNGKPLKHIEVLLDGATVKMALKLGDGDLSLGIRRAVVLAGMRQF
jgi:hypothetical protein